VTDPLTLVRSVHFAATVLTVGTVGFLALVAEPADTKGRAGFAALRRQLNLLIWLALAVAILSGAAWLVLLASDILGAPIVDVCLHGGAWPVLLDTRFGLVWCARLALVLLLGLLILWPATRAFQLAAALALIASLAVVGQRGPRRERPETFTSSLIWSICLRLVLGSAAYRRLPCCFGERAA
jgi:putative copper resistance protein D